MSQSDNKPIKPEPLWWVYILKCSDQSFYCGVTIDVKRRVIEHNTDLKKGAKYTRARRPVSIIYQCSFFNRSLACKEESRIKKLTRKQKTALIDSESNAFSLINEQ